MESKALQLKATVDGVRTLKDRSLRITITTQELAPDNASKLISLQNSLCDVLINDKGISENEMKMLKDSKWGLDDIPNSKSPSQRLRAVLYRLWEQNNEDYKDSELFYRFK